MTVWDLVAVVVTVCVIVTMTTLLLLLTQLLSVLRDLRSVAKRLAEDVLPAVDNLKDTVDHADVEMDRLHGVIGTAEELSRSLRTAGRKSVRATSTPFIKVKAAAAGLKSAIARMKHG